MRVAGGFSLGSELPWRASSGYFSCLRSASTAPTNHPLSEMSRDFLNPEAPIEKSPGDLPHWTQGEVMQFVTFRLGDSIPVGKLKLWKEGSLTFKSAWPPPWDPETEAEYHRRFTSRLERWLDAGEGGCLFRESHCREILENALMHFNGGKVEHHAWVIMPNHVHLLFKPFVPLEELVQGWKSVSARRIGKGSIWQSNYRDTLIRDGSHFANAVRYIRENPVKAKLPDDQFTLWESDRAKLVS